MEKSKKVCLITGASSGIGYAITEALKKDDNYQLIITARRADRLKVLQSGNVDILAGDLTSPSFQRDVEKYIMAKYGECHYLFNCAGSLEVGSIAELNIEKMAAMIRLNVESTFRLTYTFLKRFKHQGFGHVVNISSVLGTKVRPTAGAYAATKFALEALSEALRMELAGTAIKVSCIAPGLVMTELHNDWPVHPSESMNISTPLTTTDIVNAVMFIMQQPAHVNIPRIVILPKGHII